MLEPSDEEVAEDEGFLEDEHDLVQELPVFGPHFQDADVMPEPVVRSTELFPRQLLVQCLQKGALVTATYPLRLAKTLVQMGYIPKELATESSIGGVQMRGIPSIFDYMKYVRSDEGMSGLIRGEISYCSSVVLYCLVNYYTTRKLSQIRRPLVKHNLYNQVMDIWWTTAISSAVAVVVTHPLAVLSLRQISQFIGKENIYSVVALKHLLIQPGVFGLLDGLMPRYIYLMVPALSAKLLVKAYDHCLAGHSAWHHPHSSEDAVSSVFYVRPNWVRKLLSLAAVYYVSDVLYPFDVVFVMSSVAHSGVVPGEYPFTPVGGTWISRLLHMARHHQLWRRTCVLNKVFTENSGAFIEY